MAHRARTGHRLVSTHSRLKAAGNCIYSHTESVMFQHTAACRRLEGWLHPNGHNGTVSTHSRLKAAGGFRPVAAGPLRGFNTQPPEGGWDRPRAGRRDKNGFNTQPPEGGWAFVDLSAEKYGVFQHTAA